MAVKAADLEVERIAAVCARVRERLPDIQAAQCERFVRQYYQWVAPDDLARRRPLDLYGAALAQWKLAQTRRPGEVKLRVYNPEFDRHGWQSSHTVIELVTDDMPFLVDSVTMALARDGRTIDLVIHPVMHMRRDEHGALIDVLEPGVHDPSAVGESIIHAEVTRESSEVALGQLTADLERVLHEVAIAVADWQPMRERCLAAAAALDRHPPPAEADETKESQAFLQWLADDHFTFLGYREYELVSEDGETGLRAIPHTGLGLLRGAPATPYTPLVAKAEALARSPHPLVLTKANSRSTVHRPSYLDYVGVKTFGPGGAVTGELRFLGLYTTSAYRASIRDIPLLRGKLRRVLGRAGFEPDSHDAKALAEVIESYPRDSLLQITADDLFDIATGILSLGERQRLRVFVRRDPLDRFMDCLVCIPRDRFNTDNRERVARILVEAFGGTHVDWTLQLSESLLARVHYIVHCDETPPDEFDAAEIEETMVRAIRAWRDDLREALADEHDEQRASSWFRRYENAFPPAYRDDWVARAAVADIAKLELIATRREPIMSLYQPLEAPAGTVRCKLYSVDDVLLSDVLPTFEHMGAKVVDERPYEITPSDREPVWIYDFGLQCSAEDADRVRERFQQAFLDVRRGTLEDDRLNGLVLRAGLDGREITIVRAVAKYLRQGGIPFSYSYMQRTLLAHPDVVELLVALFKARFDPDRRDHEEAERLVGEIERAIDAVESLDEDRILRSFLTVVSAMLRVNYFRRLPSGDPPPQLAFKLDPALVPVLPLPRPRFEIFVYSPRVEGVHLRGGRVARGGLRWSDRPEDFRTEVLGLMKAQMVKNALIVPVGSKGGFVLKRPPVDGGREALTREGIACYRTFLSGLLDLTDNILGGEVQPPARVVRYDEDDPYLVVAADKGTASFSDIANEVSAQYGFWLGDAFASGGSRGYDHKQMGITARGAWESVKRHFRELGTDVQSTDFTAVGIGDMSGDVFGNGLLRSRHTKLVAAFNHLHVFIDPDPDPERSFEERRRLFHEDRSTWADYDLGAVSEGGGVYPRTAKSITLSPQARLALGTDSEKLAPNELIRVILRAPVDLLWNGGIGTYVKAASESHADAGDKGNDQVRIDGNQLRCKVVGEGGNLGLTQRGRIEFALGGGRINTDAIDNVAGVNCSDHEVNIKILLDAEVEAGDMTAKQRNELLLEMTDAVADSVLYASYTQTQALSLALAQATQMIDVHGRLIRYLEQVASLNRELEFLPGEEALAERRGEHQGLCSPELAVVMAYCKIHLYAQLLESDLPEDPHLAQDLERYFPSPLPEGFSRQMHSHRLRREIIATVVANQLVDRAGTTFAFRLYEETGGHVPILARGYAVARDVLDMGSFWADVEGLDNVVDAHAQLDMLIEGRRLMERATRWLVRASPTSIDIAQSTSRFADGARMVAGAQPEILDGEHRDHHDQRIAELLDAGVPEPLARRVAGLPALLATFDIIDVARECDRPPETVMRLYFRLGSRLELNWLRDRIIALPRANRWQALARAALRDDLGTLHRALTQEILLAAPAHASATAALDAWSERNGAQIERCLGMLADVRSSRIYDTTTLPVALREVRNLVRS